MTIEIPILVNGLPIFLLIWGIGLTIAGLLTGLGVMNQRVPLRILANGLRILGLFIFLGWLASMLAG